MSVVDPQSVHESGDTGPAGALLDHRTQLYERDQGWSVRVAPEVGEAVVYWDREARPTGESQWSKLSESRRRELNAQRVQQRARKQLRQYAVRNKLTRLVTLTFRCQACDGDPCWCGEKSDPGSRDQVKAYVNRAMVALREVLGVDALPYVYVIERGARYTMRLHVHLAVSGDVSEQALEAAWPHGHVDVSDSTVRGGVRARARGVATYLAKYLAKSLGDEDPAWAHSYERSQGFNLRVVAARRLSSLGEAFGLVHRLLGAADALRIEWSDSWEDWFGPPLAVITDP